MHEYHLTYFSSPCAEDKQLGSWVNCAGHFRSMTHILPNRTIPAYVLLYCVAGSGSYRLGEKAAALQAGDLCCLPANLQHAYRCAREGWDIWWLHFEGGAAPNLLGLAGLALPHIVKRVGVQPALVAHFAEVTALLRDKPLYYALDAATALIRLLVEVRKMNDASPALDAGFFSTLTYQTASLEEAAQRSGYSKYHFIRYFKHVTGITPWRYILLLKIDKAKELLGEPRMTIKEAARQVGIDDANYFSRLFKKMTGSTPHSFRAALEREPLLRD
jgi:AraC-like DNA-binding protein